MTDILRFRNARASDLPFVYSTWLREARAADGSPLPDDLWFDAHRALINRILSDPRVCLTVAHPADDPDMILGYIVAERGELLAWIHVKERFRRQGIARRLLELVDVASAPAGWTTPLGRERLRNPRRPRKVRSRWKPTLEYQSTASA